MKKMTKYEKIMAGGPRYLAKIIASIKIGYRKKIAKLENFDMPWDIWQEEEDLLTESIFNELMLDEENAKLQQKIKELEKQMEQLKEQKEKPRREMDNFATVDPRDGGFDYNGKPLGKFDWNGRRLDVDWNGDPR
jgi:hypothetical protein